MKHSGGGNTGDKITRNQRRQRLEIKAFKAAWETAALRYQEVWVLKANV